MAKAEAKPSPFAPARLPDMPSIQGVRFATAEAGIRYQGRTDLMVAVLDPGTVAAGVLTHSKTCSAPVLWCREEPEARQGARAGRQLRQRQRLHRQEGQRGRAHHGGGGRQGCGVRRRARSIVASTGVIGEPMDAGKFAHLLDGLAKTAKPDAFEAPPAPS